MSNPPDDFSLEEATRHRFLSEYLSFTRRAVGIDDCIVVFYARHGHTETGIRGEIGYLVPYDGDTGDLSSLIRWDEPTSNSELSRAETRPVHHGCVLRRFGTDPGS